MPTCLVQLGNAGDLVSLLPILREMYAQGRQPAVVTQPEFIPVLEATSYVTPISLDLSQRHIHAAQELARDRGYDDVVTTQVFANTCRAPWGGENWQTEQWCRAGFETQFHELPTVFDRRDFRSEAESLGMHMPKEDGRPLLVYNLSGRSQPYRHAECQRRWIELYFPEHRKVDIGDLRLPNITHLLAFIERAEVLITVDTSTVHLAHTSNTPTIVFLPENLYPRSEPRSHWVYACTHAQSITPEHRAVIANIVASNDYAKGRLVRPMRRIAYVLHPVDYWLDDGLRESTLAAQETWDRLMRIDSRFRTLFHERGEGPPPTLRELIERKCRDAFDHDWILYAGGNIPIDPSIPELVRDSDAEAFEVKPGIFAFRKRWWSENSVESECEGDGMRTKLREAILLSEEKNARSLQAR